MPLKPCVDCGELSDEARCPEHRPPAPAQASAHARGYDQTWRKLSERARRLQPFCSDCYSTEDLTTDHSERAWRRKSEGKPIRLRDVDVVCRSCNSKRGRARPTTAPNPLDPACGPRVKAKSESLFSEGGGVRDSR